MKVKTKKGDILIDKEDYEKIKYSLYVDSLGYVGMTAWDSKTQKPVNIRLHRHIMDAQKGQYVDHINGNKLDNRRKNLRLCTNQENGFNRTSPNKNNTSGHRGVTWDKVNKKWTAQITVNYKTRKIGRFIKLEDAVAAREAAFSAILE